MPRIISVDGNIGAGKSTLLAAIAQWARDKGRADVSVVPEPLQKFNYAQGNLLEHYYKDPAKYAFCMQVACFSWRSEILESRSQNTDAEIVFIERSPLSDDIFARANVATGSMTPLEYEVYKEYVRSRAWSAGVSKIQDVLLVQTGTTECGKRIVSRKRQEEAPGIDMHYLQKLEAAHVEWQTELAKEGVCFHCIDEAADFRRPEVVDALMNTLGL